MRKGKPIMILAAGFLTCSNSLATNVEPPLPTGMTREQLFGTVLRDSKWRRDNIQVCWENPSASDASYRGITRAAVQDTWERHSRVRFTGWGTCGPSDQGVRIRIDDSRPGVQVVGRYLDGRPDGMSLNFTFANWSQECASGRNFCVYAIAAHEFGHALGFTHEQNRPDRPDRCQEPVQGTVGDYLVTRYDPDSIMNYCNERWNGDGRLSALDIEALRLFYGA